jgi:PAS domain S-box-containing protein
LGTVTERIDEGAFNAPSTAHLQALGAAADQASLCIAILAGRDLRFSYVNAACQALAPGITMLGRTYRDVFPEAARAGAEAALQRTMDAGKTRRVERYRAPVPAQADAVWQGEVVPVATRAGEAPALAVLVENVAARMRTEEALQRQQAEAARVNARLNATLDAITDGVLVLDREWRYTYVSERAGEILGIRPADLLGGCVWDLFPAAEGTRFHEGYHQAVKSGRPVHFEEFYPAPLNQWLECHCYPGADELAVYFRDVTSRKRDEAERQRAYERYERQVRLFDGVASTTPDFVYVFDLEGRFQYANRRLLEVWGMRIEDVVGKTCRQLGYEQWHHDMHMRELAQVIATKRGLKGEVPFKAPLTGIFGIYEYIFTPVMGPDGDVEAVAGTTRDVTERKSVEERLRASEEQARRAERHLALALRAARSGDFDWDAKSDVNRWSDELLALYGLSREQFGGRSEDWIACLVEEDRPAGMAAIKRSFETGTFELEFRIRRADNGELRWIYARAEVTFDDNGAPVRMIGINVDITERKHSEALAAEGERRFQAVIDAAPAALTLLRPVRAPDGAVVDFEWQYMNRAARETIGRPIHELTGARIGATLPGTWEAPGLFSAFVRAMETGSAQTIEVDSSSPGAPGTYLNVAAPYESDALVVWFVDISERKRMEAKLREADRRKDEFLATLSHELRNPLAPIRTAAKLLGNPRLETGQLAWAQSVIQRQVGHMARLLEDLLDVARITQGKLELKPEPVSLVSVVDAAVEAARPLLDDKRHRLAIALPDTPKTVQVDPTRMSQVLSNLLTNAAKYTDAGGSVELAVVDEGGMLRLEVRDNGIGIPPQARAKLFEMFSQIDSARSEGGLGIGLALVKGLVELHGGTVEVQSEGAGHGSTFVVSIPAHAGVFPAAAAAGALRANAAPARLKVLIADDNADAADTLAVLIGMYGHEVRVAHGGRPAVSILQTFRPDVAFVDIGMPDLNGYEVARAVRRDASTQGMHLVAITGWGQEEDKRRASAAGFDDHLTKPVDPDRVAEVLTQFVRQEQR